MNTHVLVVDDEEIICALFAQMLREYGCYDVLTTTNGLQVVEILRRDPFDVVLFDMSMPTVSGLDVLRQITQTFEELPVIIVTGHGSIEGAVESMQAGAADFVTSQCRHLSCTSASRVCSSPSGFDGLPGQMG